MPWSSVAFSVPAAANAINTALAAIGPVSDAELTAADGRLAAVEGSASFVLSPAAALATGAGAERANFEALLKTLPSLAVVHPFTGGAGQGFDYSPYLSAPDAINLMAEKLTDAQDLPATATAGLFVLLTATDAAGLSAALAVFNGVLGNDELRWAELRAQGLVNHASARMAETTAALPPYWRGLDTRACSGADSAAGALTGLLALADGHDAENLSPSDELHALIAKKQQYIADTAQAYSDLTALFQGGAGQAIYLEAANGSALRSALLAEAGAGAEWVQCAAAAWVASPAELLFLKEAMGL